VFTDKRVMNPKSGDISKTVSRTFEESSRLVQSFLRTTYRSDSEVLKAGSPGFRQVPKRSCWALEFRGQAWRI